ncbi:MAG: flagellar biosynthesis anti-sigma factor FlgM [Eubacterium sp.]|nr:flagellar biosynthesis anti-sigma factor FlgM [Eubacterium sp.]
MRIDSLMQVNQLYQTTKPRVNKADNTQASFMDSLEISDKAQDYQVAKKAVSEAPDVRSEKVQDIMNRMKNGTYYVSDEELADNLAGRLLGL